MGLFERAIVAIAPSVGARRARARADYALATAQQRYVDSWSRNDLDSRRLERQADRPHSRADRAKIRDVMETNPFAVKMLSSLLNDAVGWGITGVPRANKKVIQDFKDWAKVCDFDAVLDLYGQQELIARTLFVDGEVFIVRHIDTASTSTNPLRIQINDADMLDTRLGGGALLVGAGIRDGIEYDASNRPVAYHFKASRDNLDSGSSRRVGAENVIHLYRRVLPGQRRGRSYFEALLGPIEEVEGYLEAETMRKRIEACFAGFIQPGDGDENGDVGQVVDGDGRRFDEESLVPGMLTRLRPGETITFSQPHSTSDLDAFMRWAALRMSAASAGTTYEDVTGDLSKVNFSSFKAGALNKKRFISRFQYLHLIPRCLDPIWLWWLDAQTVTRGGVGLSRATIEWTPPPFETIDRAGEAKADALEISNRTNSRRKIVASAGFDYDELQDEIASDRKADDVRGLDEPALPGAPTSTKDDADGTSA